MSLWQLQMVTFAGNLLCKCRKVGFLAVTIKYKIDDLEKGTGINGKKYCVRSRYYERRY